jgi:hypothetical protein
MRQLVAGPEPRDFYEYAGRIWELGLLVLAHMRFSSGNMAFLLQKSAETEDLIETVVGLHYLS